MIRRILLLAVLSIVLISCQFMETMVLSEDGSGTMSVEVNMNEMMAFGAMQMTDSVPVKLDTLIYVKQFLEEKKDSIAKLSEEEQLKIKKLENYNIHVKMDTEASEMIYNISTSFKKVSEANDILNGLEQASNFMPDSNQNSGETKKEESIPEIIGVNYTFENSIFKRDAYIKNKKRHQQEVDSLQQGEAFLGGAGYTLNYTFPRPIKKVSDPAATFSNDKKTLSLRKSFIDYFKNPDILDLEVELEK